MSHIKTKHIEDVDDEVLSTLYNDLRKARRRMELTLIQSKQQFQTHPTSNIRINSTAES